LLLTSVSASSQSDDVIRGGDWVGDVGHLTLADSALSELLIDMLRMLDHGHLSATPREPDPGLTTRQAARGVRKVQKEYPRLVPDDADDWLNEVLDAAEKRNELLHAVALNRCDTCGTATLFQHPRTGKVIDRGEEAVQTLTEKLLDLKERGGEIAEQMATLVNKQIILGAMLLADDTGEAIVPETVRPHVTKHTCGDCNGDGRATAAVTIQLGNTEIMPTGLTRRFLEGIRKREG
jgi:hypothetical protein